MFKWCLLGLRSGSLLPVGHSVLLPASIINWGLYVVVFTGINCYMPANGESAYIPTKSNISVDMSLGLMKRGATSAGLPAMIDPKKGRIMRGALIMKDSVWLPLYFGWFLNHF